MMQFQDNAWTDERTDRSSVIGPFWLSPVFMYIYVYRERVKVVKVKEKETIDNNMIIFFIY